MRILVTGGAGYIGSHTVRALRARGDTVTIVDDLSTGHRDFVPHGVALHVESLHTVTALAEIIVGARVDAVIHFAARSLVGEDARSPALYYSTNVCGTLALLGAMLRANVKRIVFSSSCSVYGAPERLPVTEDEALKPISVYGETKRAMESAIRAYADRYGWTWASLRYFNAAGAATDGTLGERHDPETHLVPNAIRGALGSGPPLTIFGDDYPTPDGTPIRDYVHVEDLAAAHVAALALDSSAAVNLGTGRGASVLEVIGAVERAVGRPVPRAIAPRRPGDPPRLVASNALARSLLGWSPAHDLESIVATAAEWERTEAGRA